MTIAWRERPGISPTDCDDDIRFPKTPATFSEPRERTRSVFMSRDGDLVDVIVVCHSY